jgi:hypothetical protein
MTRLKYATLVFACLCALTNQSIAEDARPHVKIRGIYGGVPGALLEHGTLSDYAGFGVAELIKRSKPFGSGPSRN